MVMPWKVDSDSSKFRMGPLEIHLCPWSQAVPGLILSVREDRKTGRTDNCILGEGLDAVDGIH